MIFIEINTVAFHEQSYWNSIILNPSLCSLSTKCGKLAMKDFEQYQFQVFTEKSPPYPPIILLKKIALQFINTAMCELTSLLPFPVEKSTLTFKPLY